MAESIHRAYLDDSGEKEYGPKTSRYFVYAAAILHDSAVRPIDAEIDQLKIATFGRADVEIKSNWVRRPDERRRRYLKPFGITEQDLDALLEKLYAIMTRDELSYAACAIDKVQMEERYGDRKWHPSATAYQFLLQRLQMHCADAGTVCHVTVDDMTGSTQAKNAWRDLLQEQHRRRMRDGCNLTRLQFTNIGDRLRFGASHRFNLLQIADLVAYNVMRQFRSHGVEWDAGGKGLQIYPPLERILSRFLMSSRNVLEGYGIVKWPRDRNGRWTVLPD